LAEVHQLNAPRREYITDGDRSDLRATWHSESGFVVISLWRGESCVATSHLTPGEAGRLASFITTGLAEMATAAGATRLAAPRGVVSPLARARQLLYAFLERRGTSAS
jgi:hypothetical protein